MLIRFGEIGYLVGIGILCIVLLLLRRRKYSMPYLVFFTIFWVYLLVVVSIVVFPLEINFGPYSPRIPPKINLIPFHVDYCSTVKSCLIGTLGNVLLTVPFGFGINWLVGVRPRNIAWLGNHPLK